MGLGGMIGHSQRNQQKDKMDRIAHQRQEEERGVGVKPRALLQMWL